MTAVVVATIVVAFTTGAVGSTVNAARVPTFKRVIIVVFENKSYEEVVGNPSAPTFDLLSRRYALLTQYFAVAHPSLPNYLALVSGKTQGVTENCFDCIFSARNLADTIEASGRTWKTYAEDLPAPGFTGSTSGGYSKHHNPLLYFSNVLSQPKRLGRIVPYPQFQRDLSRRRLPDFSLVVPNACNSTHDCSIDEGDNWLGAFLKPLLGSPQMANGVVFVSFDEAERSDTAGGGGRVATLVLGPLVRPGARSAARLTHYSLLRTIEDGWRLPHLGKAASATPIGGIWRVSPRG
jgi:acid phosphatase